MVSPGFSRERAEIDILRNFLHQTQGQELAILSRKNTRAIQEGMLRDTSGEGRKVTHHCIKLKTYTLDQIMQDDRIRDKAISALREGFLGIRRDKQYAFNAERTNEFTTAGAKSIVVTNTPPGETADLDGLLVTIAGDVLQKILEELNNSDKDTSTPEKESELIGNFTTQQGIVSARESTKQNRNTIAATQSKAKQSADNQEALIETERAEDIARQKSAQKKDEIHDEKLRKFRESDQLKAERMQSEITRGEISEAALNELLKNGEIDEGLFNDLIKKGEIDEGQLNAMLEQGEIGEAIFELLKRALKP